MVDMRLPDIVMVGYSRINGTYDVFDTRGNCVFYGDSDKVTEWLWDNGYVNDKNANLMYRKEKKVRTPNDQRGKNAIDMMCGFIGDRNL